MKRVFKIKSSVDYDISEISNKKVAEKAKKKINKKEEAEISIKRLKGA